MEATATPVIDLQSALRNRLCTVMLLKWVFQGGGMQIARFNSYALLFLKVEKISIQNYTFLESLLYQESTILRWSQVTY